MTRGWEVKERILETWWLPTDRIWPPENLIHVHYRSRWAFKKRTLIGSVSGSVSPSISLLPHNYLSVLCIVSGSGRLLDTVLGLFRRCHEHLLMHLMSIRQEEKPFGVLFLFHNFVDI